MGTSKFMHFPHMDLDIRGKDTYRHMQAGADFVFSLTPTGTILIKNTKERENIEDVLDNMPHNVDFLICEGLRTNNCNAMFILTAKNMKEIESLVKEFDSEKKPIIGITGVMAKELSNHPQYNVFDCLDEKGLEDLTDAVIKTSKNGLITDEVKRTV